MQPSSLVFVVVIGIWAAYLVQYWIRRREHMSTARSVDRFSEAMRVLERRGLALEAEAAQAGARSAVPVTDSPAGPRSPLVARVRSAQARPASGRPADGAGAAAAASSGRDVPEVTGLSGGAGPVAAGPGGSGDGSANRAGLAAGFTPRGRLRSRSRLARRLRAVGVLCAVAVVPLTAVLTVIGLVPWWTVLVAIGEVALCLVALRLAAVREQTARHTERSMSRSQSRVSAAPAEPFDAVEPAAKVTEPDSSDRGTDELLSAAPAQPAYRPGDPTWSPVPVPRPTYQLKDPAPEPRPQPVPQVATETDEPPVRLPRRRAVGG